MFLINDNGGFTVVWWYKRGDIPDKFFNTAQNIDGVENISNHNNNDKNNEGMLLDSVYISYHIV